MTIDMYKEAYDWRKELAHGLKVAAETRSSIGRFILETVRDQSPVSADELAGKVRARFWETHPSADWQPEVYRDVLLTMEYGDRVVDMSTEGYQLTEAGADSES